MTKAAPTTGWRRTLRRFFWLPLLLGLVVGSVLAATAESEDAYRTVAVVNTRAASSEPNERVDLINDLISIEDVSSIYATVAEEFDVSEQQLHDGLSVTQIAGSTSVSISLTSDDGNEVFRREVLQAFLDEVVGYLGPKRPTSALTTAENAQNAAIDAYYAAIENNGGFLPSDTLRRLQQRLIAARDAQDVQRQQQLRQLLPGAIHRAAEFEKLRARMSRAIAQVTAVSEAEASSSTSGLADLRLTFVDDDVSKQLASSPALRRGVAGGLATALIVAAIVIVLGARRRA